MRFRSVDLRVAGFYLEARSRDGFQGMNMTIAMATLQSSMEIAGTWGTYTFQGRPGFVDGSFLWNLSVVFMPFPIVGFIILVLYRGK